MFRKKKYRVNKNKFNNLLKLDTNNSAALYYRIYILKNTIQLTSTTLFMRFMIRISIIGPL